MTETHSNALITAFGRSALRSACLRRVGDYREALRELDSANRAAGELESMGDQGLALLANMLEQDDAVGVAASAYLLPLMPGRATGALERIIKLDTEDAADARKALEAWARGDWSGVGTGIKEHIASTAR